MGKGDKKTWKGKMFKGSHGISRPKNIDKAYVPGSVAKQEVVAPVAEVKVATPAPKATSKAKA